MRDMIQKEKETIPPLHVCIGHTEEQASVTGQAKKADFCELFELMRVDLEISCVQYENRFHSILVDVTIHTQLCPEL